VKPSTKTKASPKPRPSTEQRVIDAARAVLARNPGATVDEIVQRSGVSRATFFRAWRGRDELLRAVATAALAELERGLAAALVDLEGAAVELRLRAAINVLVAHGEHLRFLASAVELYEDPTITEAAAAADQHIAPLIDEAIAAGLLRADVARSWLWAATDALVFAAWHEVSVGRLARADAARVVEQTLLCGFGPAGSSSSSLP
jgi:TetR/AcrR family transcriptional regulator, mexCD-oprJ operon repressor